MKLYVESWLQSLIRKHHGCTPPPFMCKNDKASLITAANNKAFGQQYSKLKTTHQIQ